ncbi:MAG: hypothetical protein RL150_236 [Candidatus Parcubacteria bacterium]|jgi:DNA polymerase-3 subunit delta'
MQLLRDIYKNTGDLHHAYVLEGSPEPVVEELALFCTETLGVPARGNPDYVCEVHDRFLIEHARRLRELQQNKTRADSKKLFVVAFNFITREAQNALLKVLEEPTAGTHIFIVTPSSHVFLPTVLSRVTVLKTPYLVTHDHAQTFLKSSYKKRMEYITKLTKDIKDEKASKAEALALVRSLVVTLYAGKHDVVVIQKIAELDRLGAYLEDSSASVKMLLEHAALVV